MYPFFIPPYFRVQKNTRMGAYPKNTRMGFIKKMPPTYGRQQK